MPVHFYRCACVEKDGDRLVSCYSHKDKPEPRDPTQRIVVNFTEPEPRPVDPDAPRVPDPLTHAATRVSCIIAALKSDNPAIKRAASFTADALQLFP